MRSGAWTDFSRGYAEKSGTVKLLADEVPPAFG
jgi:hypothetical protein